MVGKIIHIDEDEIAIVKFDNSIGKIKTFAIIF